MRPHKHVWVFDSARIERRHLFFKTLGLGRYSIELERTAIAANSPTVATKEIQDATINACGDENRCADRKRDIHVR